MLLCYNRFQEFYQPCQVRLIFFANFIVSIMHKFIHLLYYSFSSSFQQKRNLKSTINYFSICRNVYFLKKLLSKPLTFDSIHFNCSKQITSFTGSCTDDTVERKRYTNVFSTNSLSNQGVPAYLYIAKPLF